MRLPFRKKYRISFGYNKVYSRIAGLIGKRHNGIDYATPVGTKLYAPCNGRVNQVNRLFWGYGRHLRLRCGNLVVLLAHLSKHYCKKGQRVKKGQLIAKSGNTGWSTGPHLHLGIRDVKHPNRGIDGWQNPKRYFRGLSKPIKKKKAKSRKYTVRAGDSLWKIAERFYGRGRDWEKIYRANREFIDDSVLIKPGQVIKIPK